LINSIDKLFEKLLKIRIQSHLCQQPDGIAHQQFGFTKGRSTIQAIEKVMQIVERSGTGQLYNRKLCALVSHDVANAFYTAPWEKIDAALLQKRVPHYLVRIIRSYFEGRSIQTEGTGHAVSAGVPQGSVIGPIL